MRSQRWIRQERNDDVEVQFTPPVKCTDGRVSTHVFSALVSRLTSQLFIYMRFVSCGALILIFRILQKRDDLGK